jgi:type IV pilus assembly protein PilF
MFAKPTIKFVSLLSLIVFISSCSSTGSSRKKYNGERTENTGQVSASSAEMINVELGVGYLKRGHEGDEEVALQKFKKAISINPKFALAHSMLANVYDRKGLFESAKKHYELSQRYNNGNPDITNNYANFLCQRGFYDRAIKMYLEVVSNPKYNTPASAYENAGICAQKAKKADLAEQYFRKAIENNSKQANSLYYLMLNYIEQQKYMKARAFLQRLEQVVRPSSEMLAAGYTIEKKLNHNELANKYLTRLKKEFPGSESLKTIMSM